MSEDLEHAWRIKDYILREIQFSDSKAGAIIAISTLAIGLLVLLPIKDLCTTEAIIVAISTIPLLISLIFALISVYPRKTAVSGSGSIFWRHISKYKQYSDYETAFDIANKKTQVLKQVYALAKIAKRKYSWVSLSIIFQIIGLAVFWIVVWIIGIF